MLARWTVALLERELASADERRAVLARHGVMLDALLAADARLSHGTACALWEELTAEHADPLLGVRFARALSENLEVRLLPHDPALERYLVPSAEHLLERLPRGDDLLAALEVAIVSALPSGTVTIERMARELGVGVRTLQRRLRSRSKTFQEVVDAVRRSVAERVATRPGLSMKEAAFLLGFADPKSFRRAKDRWQRRES
ncbi:MAG: helix-turn-helix domain-containing protein [Myxococcales bacterium]|nr:helix-turn-helix domain-containing protein [Myxococcales bacterium]